MTTQAATSRNSKGPGEGGMSWLLETEVTKEKVLAIIDCIAIKKQLHGNRANKATKIQERYRYQTRGIQKRTKQNQTKKQSKQDQQINKGQKII